MSLSDEVYCRVKFAAMSELLCNPFGESEFEQESVEPGHFEASRQDKIRFAVKDKANSSPICSQKRRVSSTVPQIYIRRMSSTVIRLTITQPQGTYVPKARRILRIGSKEESVGEIWEPTRAFPKVERCFVRE